MGDRLHIALTGFARREQHLAPMCGRYSITSNPEAIRQLFGLKGPIPALKARYNVAPTQEAPVVRLNATSREREVVELRWGLIPHWAQDETIGARTINARAETVDTKPSFRDAFKRRRCLVVADGFYEWRVRGKGPKQPYRFTVHGGAPFAMAGLWERWTKGPKPIESFTIIVGEPNDLVRPIHNRMPVILPPIAWNPWLRGERGTDLLRPFPPDIMRAYPVSTKVNNPKNDDPSVIEPVN